jgi:hypothetical protein
MAIQQYDNYMALITIVHEGINFDCNNDKEWKPALLNS